MVGFDVKKKVELTGWDYATAGALSGVVTRCVAQPLDVLKIRFQLQVEPLSGESSKYHGMIQATRTILQEEGPAAFWKGHVPAQFLCIMFGAVQFLSFEHLTKLGSDKFSYKYTHGHYKPIYHFICGGISGCLASVAAQPFDVVRTRLVAQGEPKIYRNFSHAVSTMYKEEGTRSFYRGLAPTLLELFPHAGLQFGFYSFFKIIWEHVFERDHHEVGPLESVVCGGCSGICSKTIILPLDVVKKRLQIQGFAVARAAFGKAPTYNGVIHCFSKVLKYEGLAGLFKGWKPSILKVLCLLD
ncbi:mitochondrial thiamine pyrophosphate carrier-like [Saccoglossus kowalevskii]